MLRISLALLFLSAVSFSLAAQESTPRLLLTARRLHRLKLDNQRQTTRWSDFEDRVKNVPDSPERGFELALYSAVTGDETFCQEAVRWGLAHPANHRQNALIVNWCGTVIDAAGRKALLPSPVITDPAKPFSSARDEAFVRIARGDASADSIVAHMRAQWSRLLPLIQHDPRVCLPELYALFEFLDAADKLFRADLRQNDGQLFANLPGVFLLSLSSEQLEKPKWQTRVAGLMMVSLDPNLQGSSFVQGWAMEDPKTVHDGPGVAYEFLWANPYLPGLGYYNMPPWVYDRPSGLLLARSSWEAPACRISLFRGQLESLGCPPDVRTAPAEFGKLTLLPLQKSCATVPAQGGRTFIISGLEPQAIVQWQEGGKKVSGRADASGLFQLSAETVGKVCQSDSR